MELEPDPYRLARISPRYREERSGVWWITLIVVGVFIGNLLSFGAYQLYVRWELQQVAIALRSDVAELAERSKAEAVEQAERLKAEMERTAKNNAAVRRQREKQNEVNAKLLQTCEFWRQEVAKENTEQNRAYRDTACSRASSAVR